MKIPKERLDILKKFIEQECYHADSNTQELATLHPIKNSTDPSRPSTNPSDDV